MNTLKALLGISVILFLDLFTKYMAAHYLHVGAPIAVFPGFNWSLSYNPGAAFSFLADQSGWQRIFLSAISVGAVAFFGYCLWRTRVPAERWALVLIIGGALGNLWDRLTTGYVVDFIQWHVGPYYWPAFNIADSAICLGVALFLGQLWYNRRKESGSRP